MQHPKLIALLIASVGAPQITRAPANYLLDFSPGEKVETTSPFVELDNLAQLTIEAEITVNSTADWTRILSREVGPMDRVSVQLHQGKVYCFVANGANSFSYTPQVTILPGARHHLAVVYDGNSPAGIELYIDGVPQVLTDSLAPLPATAPTNLAVFRVADGVSFNGLVDEVRIWDRALSAQRIDSWKNRKLTPAHPEYSNLLLYWAFNDHWSPSVAHGSLNTNVDGTITGALYRPEFHKPRTSTSTSLPPRKIVGGYLPHYSMGNVQPEVFDFLTHAYYFSLAPSPQGELGRVDSAGAFTPLSSIPSVQTDINTLRTWRGSKPAKILLVVGGWIQSDYFDEAAANPSARANLVANILSFCQNYGVDGVDFDWEGYHGAVNDANYGLLISQVRAAFSGSDLELAATINPTHTSLIDEFAETDFVQLMSYGKSFGQNTQVPLSMLQGWVDGWVNGGFTRSKLVVGLPAFGRTPADNTSVTYREIFQTYGPGPAVDSVLHNGKLYYFNGIDTVKLKSQYVMDTGLGGVMMWELGHDMPVLTTPASLLRAVCEVVPVGP